MKKRIGILTSGGDCAGLNAIILSVTLHATRNYGFEVFGIKQGLNGLINKPVQALKLSEQICDFSLLRMGGTILGTTNKGNPFSFITESGETKDLSSEVVNGYKELDLNALIGIGGDGSLEILSRFSKEINFIGIPKTIDNDLGITEVSVGFSTAVDIAAEALDRLQPTAASHNRVMILQVMGRDAGHIALNAGIAGGADIILIPEIPYDLNKIANKIKELHERNQKFALIIVAEAVTDETGTSLKVKYSTGQARYGGIGDYLGKKIQELTGAETRVTVLGHLQRGSSPSANDRIIASAFGVHAVELIAKDIYSRVVVWKNRGVIDIPLEDITYQKVDINGTLVKTAKAMGISFGG